MTEHNDGFPNKYKLFTPFETIKKLAHLVFDQFQYPTPSEHHTTRPFDEIEPVTHIQNELPRA